MLISSRTLLAQNRAVKDLGRSSHSQRELSESLASGSRMNSAATDVGLTSQLDSGQSDKISLGAAMRNMNDGLSMLSTMEGTLSAIESTITRIRELAVQASNETYNGTDRVFMNTEVLQNFAQLDALSGTTNYNGVNLFGNAETSFTLQVGLSAGSVDQLNIDLSSFITDSSTLGFSSDVLTTTNAQGLISESDVALQNVLSMRSRIGSHQQQLSSMLSDSMSKQENITETVAEQSDTDFAKASAELTSEGIKTQSALAAMTQARAIQQNTIMGLLQ